MDYLIIFVGIIMIAGAPKGMPFRALLPSSTGNMTFCNAHVTVPPHEAYLRVEKTRVLPDDTHWPEDPIPCDPPQTCELFRISTASDLSINSVFDPGIKVRRLPTYCLLPQLEEFPSTRDVTEVSDADTIAVMPLPGGEIFAKQLNNGAIYPFLRVHAPQGAQASPITITATERGSRTTHTLVLKPGTTIALVNATKELAKKKLSAVDPHAGEDAHVHFVLLSKLLPNGVEICRRPPTNRDVRCPGIKFDPGVTGDVGCSGGGCCE
jgi:hypothetical protein